jgi:hypothetical protein
VINVTQFAIKFVQFCDSKIYTMQNVIKSIKEHKGTSLDVRSVMEFQQIHINRV